MSLLTRSRAAWRALTGSTPTARRGFNATQAGRLYADWFAHATSSDAEIRGSLRKLIDRSRDLERNNDYQRGFLLSLERNVLGAIRHDLRMDCGQMVPGAKGQPPVWQPDRSAAAQIEDAWREWGKKGTCTVCGRYSWRDVKRLALRANARDGNFLARKIRGAASRNRFGFALQLWEIDHLDLDRFDTLRGGGEIRFGIEFDAVGRAAAYHLRARHPGDYISGGSASSQIIRVPAEEIYHLFTPERAEQSVGFPWIVSAITRLRQLGAFEEAATIAARLGASKAGFFERDGSKDGDFEGEGTDDAGRAIMDASPGTFESLPPGWKLADWSPEYPNITTGDFRKAMLRGVGTSLGMSYNTLGNDLEAVNFSSARVGLFEEREGWKGIQVFHAENFWEPVFSDWLLASLLSAAINLPIAKLKNFDRPVFKSRRWPFIDPLKEVNAAKTAIALRLSSRRQFIEESGGDVDDVFHDNLDDERLAEDIGLSLVPPDPDPASSETVVTDITDGSGDPGPPAPAPKPGKPAPARALTAADIAREVIRQTPAAPMAAPATPNMIVNMPAPEIRIPPAVVTVHVPEQREQLAPIVNVHVPPQPPPVIHVTVPEHPITINVPPQPAPVVNVTVPPLDATVKIKRDGDGKITSASIT